MMTEQEMRELVAEKCGYYRKNAMWYHFDDSPMGFIPNYPHDLNAVHDARHTLITTPQLRVDYLNSLRSIVERRCPRRDNLLRTVLISDYDLVNASALEHLEALCRVIHPEGFNLKQNT